MIAYYDINLFGSLRMTCGHPKGTTDLAVANVFLEAIMRAKHQDTLEAIFANPVSGSIKWRDVEALLIALGAEVSEGSGSRVRFTLSGQTLFLHRPHPAPDAKRWMVRDIREFLTNVGRKP